MRSLLTKALRILSASLTIAVLVLGMTHFSIGRHISGSVTNCPFALGHSSMCSMSSMDHVQAWQNTIVNIPLKDVLIQILLLLAFGGLLKYISLLSTHTSHKNKLSYSHSITFFNPLREAFARGILNPKIYA